MEKNPSLLEFQKPRMLKSTKKKKDLCYKQTTLERKHHELEEQGLPQP